jgi:hypothetical protein
MNREALGFPVAGASESIMFSVALVSKQPNTNPASIVAILDPPVHISFEGTQRIYERTNSMIAGFQS